MYEFSLQQSTKTEQIQINQRAKLNYRVTGWFISQSKHLFLSLARIRRLVKSLATACETIPLQTSAACLEKQPRLIRHSTLKSWTEEKCEERSSAGHGVTLGSLYREHVILSFLSVSSVQYGFCCQIWDALMWSNGL